jgi:hypothetical protein
LGGCSEKKTKRRGRTRNLLLLLSLSLSLQFLGETAAEGGCGVARGGGERRRVSGGEGDDARGESSSFKP